MTATTHPTTLLPTTPWHRTQTRVLYVIFSVIAVLGVILVAVLVAQINSLSDNLSLVETLQPLLLNQWSGSSAVAIILLTFIVSLNICGLLLFLIGIVAREIWIWGIALSMILANGFMFVQLGSIPSLLVILGFVLVGVVLWQHRQQLQLNPVMLKELRGRMRGARAFAIMTVYLIVMGIFIILLYLIDPLNSVIGTAVTGELGRILFMGVVAAELALLLFIVPALTAGGITGEREQNTYDILQTTLLDPATFVVGKLESALGYIVLLLLAAIPIQSIPFLFGGISEVEVGLAFLMLLVLAFALGAIGMFFSTLSNRTTNATVRTYVAILALILLIPAILSSLLSHAYSNALDGVSLGITTNPSTEAGMIYTDMVMVGMNPITTLQHTQEILINDQNLLWATVTLSNGEAIPVLSPWLIFITVYLGLGAIFLLLAMRRVRYDQETEQP